MTAGVGASTPIAGALDWYSVWWSSSPNTPGTQTCRGELRGNLYSFRCDPLAVVVAVVVDDSGHCSIVSMSPSISEEDGLRVQTLAHLVPPRNSKPAQPRDCGELPLKDGSFELAIPPRSRKVNNALTIDARNAALRYTKQGGDDGCLLRFPDVKTGDPFFHVYEECQGALNAVWEFTIKNGKVSDFPHWSYTRRRGGFPAGAEWREGRMDLWLGVSRLGARQE